MFNLQAHPDGIYLFWEGWVICILHVLNSNSKCMCAIFLNNLSVVINAVCYPFQKNISDALLLALHNTQSALLTFKGDNEEPIVIQKAHIGMLVNR